MKHAVSKTEKMFCRFGRRLTVKTPDGETAFSAFLQPLRYKNKMYLSAVHGELCFDTMTKYLLLCPGEIDLEAVDGTSVRLCLEKTDFSVDHCEKVTFGEEILYNWAIIHKNEGVPENEN